MPKSPFLPSHYLFSVSTRVLNLGISQAQKHLSMQSPAHSSQRHFSPRSWARSTQVAFSTWALCSPLPPSKFKALIRIVQLQAMATCRSWNSPSCKSWDAARPLSHLFLCEVPHSLSTDCSCNYHSTSTPGKVTYHLIDTVINISHKDC